MILRRLAAYALDWYLISFVMNLVLVAAAYQVQGIAFTGLVPITVFEGSLRLALFAVLVGIDIIYFCVVPRYALGGQTPGKRLFRLRIERAQGGAATLPNYLVRELLGIVVIEGCFSPLSNYLRNVLLLWVPRDAVQVMVWAGIVIGVASVGLMLITRERRMLHDLVGGTRVVVLKRAWGGGSDGHRCDGAVEQPYSDGDEHSACDQAPD
ncbi:RDD family protein [Enorma sp.]|uniref:RDD family protein n=1 Tax=Enorma sp. TaxID=1920692 RepID=UPI0025C05FE1|nr:RDD family protein [Enorma sp.]